MVAKAAQLAASGDDPHREVPRERFAEAHAEQVRRLASGCAVSRDDAEKALEQSQGDMELAALLLRSPHDAPAPQPQGGVSGLLPTAELFEQMGRTRVLFSVGSASGGLDLAKRLREELLAAGADWGVAVVELEPEPTVHLWPVVSADADPRSTSTPSTSRGTRPATGRGRTRPARSCATTTAR
jgi:hypothetical protein